MSIKTDELQTVNAPALTDTLLLANSAGGTAQLSMAQAAAFFGAELVKTGNPVGTALSSKAAKSAQETVEATGVTGRDITLAAADLQAYIDALPRLRTENLGIIVGAGHVPQTLTLKDFYGPGTIAITGSGNGVLDDGLVISNCSNYIRIIGFDVRGSSVQIAARVSVSRYVALESLTADGNYFTNMNGVTDGGSNGAYVGILDEFGHTFVSNFQCSHFREAVHSTGSLVQLLSCGGSGNVKGITVEGGGIVLLGGATPELMGGASNFHGGGMIVKKDGTLL